MTAAITNRASGVIVRTTLVDGGFDPVPIAANVGDTLAVAITTVPPADSLHTFVIAASRRRPTVVRTNPPHGRRDVPLNSTIIVVFNEPIDSATLNTASIQLLLGTTPVAGTVQFASGSDLTAVLVPASPLASNTTYSLTISQQIHDLLDLPLDTALTISFSTGTGAQAPAGAKLAFTMQPQNGIAGTLLSPVVVAIQDSAGQTVTSANDLVTVRTGCAAASTCDTARTFYSLTGLVSVSAVNGVATFSQLQLGLATSGYTLVATSGTLSAATSEPFDILPSAPAQLQFLGPVRAAAAQPFTLDVEVEDALTNRVTTATNSVTLALSAGPSGASLTGTLTVDAVDGVAHFTSLSVDQPGTYTVGASAGNLGTAARSFMAYRSGALTNVSTGESHTCGWTIDNVAYCWGSNDHGQLGDGTTSNSSTPVPVSGGHAFFTLVTGGNHTCGMDLDHIWYCWGANESGQLGDGTTTDRLIPVMVGSGLSFLMLGGNHTCGVADQPGGEEVLYCWGLNDHGQLGDGTATSRTNPARVVNLGLFSGAVVAGASHTCVQDYDSANTYCWGANSRGQLDDGTTTDRLTPVSIPWLRCGSGPPGFVPPGGDCSNGIVPFNDGITTGGSHTCAAAGGLYSPSHALYCWGANTNGQLGDGTTTDRTTPVLVGGANWRAFGTASAGRSHTCAMGRTSSGSSTGDVYCWGSNGSGQLGDGTVTKRTNPVLVTGGFSFLSVSAGGNHTCGVTAEGVYCWGSNSAGQLGNGGTGDSNVPVKVANQQ